MSLRNGLEAIYGRLLSAYGPQHWWPAQSAFEVIVGAILTQRTAWANAARAIVRLAEADVLTPEALLRLTPETLAELVRPAGFRLAKTRTLRAVSARILDGGSSMETFLALPQDELRAALLHIGGIGPETADAIVLYAAGLPTFVVDAYTRRILTRLGIAPTVNDYDSWQVLFMSHLPSDAALFNEYHAVLVQHAKLHCRLDPCCGGCPLRTMCEFPASERMESLSRPVRRHP